MQALELDGRHIEYRMVLGDALHGPTLVFLHEGLGCAALWRDFPDKLARRIGAPALVYSRFGYGRSSGLARRRTPRFMHEEALDVLPAVLDRLGITNPLLIGHSDGASIALIHAASGGRAVAGVVLMAPHVFVEPISVRSIAQITDTYRKAGLRERLARYHDHVDDAFLGWSQIWLDPSFRDWSLDDETSRLAVPSLLIQGDHDEYGTQAQIDRVMTGAPVEPECLILPGVGHAPWREAESAVLEAITAFATRQAPRTRL
ncbi:MAG: alpha/beta fold hydrolase [Hyphomicrobiaceae bacterium]